MRCLLIICVTAIKNSGNLRSQLGNNIFWSYTYIFLWYKPGNLMRCSTDKGYGKLMHCVAEAGHGNAEMFSCISTGEVGHAEGAAEMDCRYFCCLYCYCLGKLSCLCRSNNNSY